MAEGKNLFRIVHGNPENLKGEAIVFSMLTNEKRLISRYVTVSCQKLEEKFPEIPIGDLESGIKLLETQFNIHCMSYGVWIDSEKASNPHNEDIIEVQGFEVPKLCQQAVILGCEEYLKLYYQQLEKRTGIKTKTHEPGINNNSFLYNLNQQERDKYLVMCHLVEQMTGALSRSHLYQNEDEENYEKLQSRLRTLDFHPEYQDRINQIIRLIEKSHWTPEVSSFVGSTLKELSTRHYNEPGKPRFSLD